MSQNEHLRAVLSSIVVDVCDFNFALLNVGQFIFGLHDLNHDVTTAKEILHTKFYFKI